MTIEFFNFEKLDTGATGWPISILSSSTVHSLYTFTFVSLSVSPPLSLSLCYPLSTALIPLSFSVSPEWPKWLFCLKPKSNPVSLCLVSKKTKDLFFWRAINKVRLPLIISETLPLLPHFLLCFRSLNLYSSLSWLTLIWNLYEWSKAL